MEHRTTPEIEASPNSASGQKMEAMKKVIILGAKPDAKQIAGDAIYCANGAIGAYAEYVSTFDRIVSIVSAGLLAPDKRQRSDVSKEKYGMIVNGQAHTFVLANPRDYPGAIEEIRHHNNKAMIVPVSSADRRKLISTVSGYADPIITRHFLKLPFSTQAKAVRQLLRLRIKYKADDDFDWPGYFRISTGVFSLIYAISENGPFCEYIISGIGIHNRGSYSFGVLGAPNILEQHVIADAAVLKELNSKYRLRTTESELADATGIQLI